MTKHTHTEHTHLKKTQRKWCQKKDFHECVNDTWHQRIQVNSGQKSVHWIKCCHRLCWEHFFITVQGLKALSVNWEGNTAIRSIGHLACSFKRLHVGDSFFTQKMTHWKDISDFINYILNGLGCIFLGPESLSLSQNIFLVFAQGLKYVPCLLMQSLEYQLKYLIVNWEVIENIMLFLIDQTKTIAENKNFMHLVDFSFNVISSVSLENRKIHMTFIEFSACLPAWHLSFWSMDICE